MPTTVTFTDEAAVDASGHLQVDLAASSVNVTVVGTGTLVVQEDGAALTALELIDDTVYVDDTAVHATGTSKGLGIMAAATPTDGSVDANDIRMLAMSVDRRLHCDADITASVALDVSAATVTVDTELAAAAALSDTYLFTAMVVPLASQLAFGFDVRLGQAAPSRGGFNMADPFESLFSGTAREGTFRNSILGFPTVEERAGGALGAFRTSVIEKLQGGLNMSAAISQTLADPTHQQVLSLPDFPKNAQEFIKLLTPPTEEHGTIAPSASTFNKATGELGAQAPGKPPEPTAAQKIVDAILASSNPEERALLTQSLLGTDGRLSVTDYLRLAAGGITTDPELLPKAITKPATQEEAEIALTLGTAKGPRAPNENDLLLAIMGVEVPGSPLNDLPREGLRGAALIKEQLRRAESKPGPLDAILAASPEAKAAGLLPEEKGGLSDLFEKMDKAEAAERGGQVIEPGKAEVPIFGTGPKVGGTGGQAPGPAVAGQQLTPEQLKSVEKMPVENFAELSRETIDQIIKAVTSGTIKLSDEQRTALLAASKATQGGAGGGAQ
ncbi:hypothetical protein LCGC14_2170880 [marine sediment metagenome]|uniref:Uncharacterized protein n=1 Tax=marine sediment metagenome TaxID=412755 RepID=A0A0F9ECC5_9ZZZZ